MRPTYHRLFEIILENYSPEPMSGCWIWTKPTCNVDGYAVIWDGKARTNIRVHRFMYEKFIGPIPENHQLHHKCETRCCINPSHLEPLTATNHNKLAYRSPCAKNKIKTHCPKGHEYAGHNLILNKGKRYCRACQRINDLNYKARHGIIGSK